MRAWTIILPNNNIGELVLDPQNSGHRGKVAIRNDSEGPIRIASSKQTSEEGGWTMAQGEVIEFELHSGSEELWACSTVSNGWVSLRRALAKTITITVPSS
jgi:hypothetical protein